MAAMVDLNFAEEFGVPQLLSFTGYVVSGLRPFRDTSFSIRNPKYEHHEGFLSLRTAAIWVMAGRTWSHDAIGLALDGHTPSLKPGYMLVHYLGGVMDTLGGTHLTYLPIAYNDDCRVCDGASSFNRLEVEWYSVRIRFLANNSMKRTALRAADDAERSGARVISRKGSPRLQMCSEDWRGQ